MIRLTVCEYFKICLVYYLSCFQFYHDNSMFKLKSPSYTMTQFIIKVTNLGSYLEDYHIKTNLFKMKRFPLFWGTLGRNLFRMNRNLFKQYQSKRGKRGQIIFRSRPRLPTLMVNHISDRLLIIFYLTSNPFRSLLILNRFLAGP